MYQEAFVKLELSENAAILERLNPEFGGSLFDPLEAVILSQNIPFYEGYRLLDIADYSTVPAHRRYVIYSKNDFILLDFTNAPIYAFNKKCPLKLTNDNIIDYVRFFLSHVRGPEGKFLIVESVDDIAWKEDPPPAARKGIGKVITPLTLKSSKNPLVYELGGCMVFKDSLIKCKISVNEQGHVTLYDQELMVEDMPILDDVFGH